jgi:hypothetical protein
MASRLWSNRSRAAARAAVAVYGLRVECLVCGTRQRFYPGGPRRLRDTVCENARCEEIALRSVYWIASHPELASEAKRRAVAVARFHHA